MGNDGGDIPKRKQLVKQKQKVQHPNMQSIAMGRSRFCNLTNQKLKAPLAIDRLGCIYNFQNILKALVQKILPSKYSYIKKLSDIKKIQIQRAANESLNYFVCPITKLQYNGFNKFVGIWTCGHVLSRKAFKQVKDQKNKCIVCQMQYKQKDIIDLNLEGEQLEYLRKILIEKKKKNNQVKQDNNDDGELTGKPEKKVKTDVYVNSLDRLSGQFRDFIRQRKNFKDLFKKEVGLQWQQNTYIAKKQ